MLDHTNAEQGKSKKGWGRWVRLWRMPVWLSGVLLVVWAVFSWGIYANNETVEVEHRTSFRSYLERMLVVTTAFEGERESRWYQFAQEVGKSESDLQDFIDLFDAAEEQGKLNEEAWVDKALMYHRYRGDVLIAENWKELAEAALAHAQNDLLEPVGCEYYVAARHLIDDEIMSEAESEMFAQVCELRPSDAWICYLAKGLGMEELVDLEGLHEREEQSWKFWLVSWGIQMGVMLAGLLLAWKFFRWQAEEPKGTRRWLTRMRRVSLAGIIGVFVLAEFAGLGVGYGYQWLSGFWMSALEAVGLPPMVAWNFAILGWMTSTIGSELLVVAILVLVFVGSWGKFCREVGLMPEDWFKARFWWMGLAGTGLAILVFWVQDMVLSWFGLGSLAGLERSMEELGWLAFPMQFTWAVLMAPLMEEVVFRGFLFRAMQQRWGAWAGAVLSSGLFAYVHFYDGVGTWCVFLYGMLFAWVYHRTGKLAASMILHGTNNLLLVMMEFRW